MGKKDTHRMTKLLYTKPALVLFDARATAAAFGPVSDGLFGPESASGS